MRIPIATSLIVGMISIGIWAFLMVFSIAFVIYELPLSLSDDKFLLYFMIKYYPFVVVGLFILARIYKDKKGIAAFSAVLLPSLFLIYLIYDMNRFSIIDWDEFETQEQKQFIYESAFGTPEKLAALYPKVKSVNFSGEQGLTPLLSAYKGRNQETFIYLLKKGANVNFMPRGSLQYNIADAIISDFYHDESSITFFEQLTNYDLNIHIGTKTSNLLQSSVKSESQWYLKYLLEKGADANRIGTVFLPPIAYAALHNKWNNANYLTPFSNQNSLEEAAAILFEHRQRGLYRNQNKERDQFEKALLDKGIDFNAAFNKKDKERQKRLEQFNKRTLNINNKH